MRNRRKAAGGQRSTSTDKAEREFSRVVGQAEPCGEGLNLFDLQNAKLKRRAFWAIVNPCQLPAPWPSSPKMKH